MKILIVDDSETSLLLTSSYLEKMGHKVVTTVDPLEALDLFKSEKPDLIILDVMMDKMDGYECARQIRNFSADDDAWVPIIFISALADDASVAAGIDSGGDEYLTKPFTETMLKSKIKAMQRISKMRAKLAKNSGVLKKANVRLTEQSLGDGLTGAANRRAFDINYSKEHKRSSRLKEDNNILALIMFDIDHFKLYNDHYGHQQGDTCLTQVANAASKLLPREIDEVYRYGGEEFIVILPLTDKEGAVMLAKRLCAGIEALQIPHSPEADSEFVTISVGVTSSHIQVEDDPVKLMQTVDEALYAAKAAGRNRVVYKKLESENE